MTVKDLLFSYLGEDWKEYDLMLVCCVLFLLVYQCVVEKFILVFFFFFEKIYKHIAASTKNLWLVYVVGFFYRSVT